MSEADEETDYDDEDDSQGYDDEESSPERYDQKKNGKFVGHHRLSSHQFQESEDYNSDLEKTMQNKYLERSMAQEK